MEKLELPPCGAFCENCHAYKKLCAGCTNTRGKPFFLKDMNLEVCPVWECANKLEIEHCGVCKKFPCDKFLQWYDPKRGIITALRRAGLLALRKRIGNKAWIEWIKKNKISFGT